MLGVHESFAWCLTGCGAAPAAHRAPPHRFQTCLGPLQTKVGKATEHKSLADKINILTPYLRELLPMSLWQAVPSGVPKHILPQGQGRRRAPQTSAGHHAEGTPGTHSPFPGLFTAVRSPALRNQQAEATSNT